MGFLYFIGFRYCSQKKKKKKIPFYFSFFPLSISLLVFLPFLLLYPLQNKTKMRRQRSPSPSNQTTKQLTSPLLLGSTSSNSNNKSTSPFKNCPPNFLAV